MIISMVWVGRDFPNIFDLNELGIQIVNAAIIVAVKLLMISNIKYYSFKTVDRKLLSPICGITNRGIYSGCDDLQYSCRHISDFNHLCTFWFCHYLSSS